MKQSVFLTCEHAGNKIPGSYEFFFTGAEEDLKSHKGWDPGALEAARELSHRLSLPLRYTEWSRLLIEANRSPDAQDLFSQYTSTLPDETKQRIINEYYVPYRSDVEKKLSLLAEDHVIIHLSIHSFTPEKDGEKRDADIGILFDPERKTEIKVADQLAESINGWNLKFNYPYKGTADGFTTYLRKRFPNEKYAGLEIELNQKFFFDEPEKWERLKSDLANAVEKLNILK